MKTRFRRACAVLLSLALSALAVVDNAALAADSGCEPGKVCKVKSVDSSAAAGTPAFQVDTYGARISVGPPRKATDAGWASNDYLASDGGRIYTGTGTKLEAFGFCPQDGGTCVTGPGFYETKVNVAWGSTDGGTISTSGALDAGVGALASMLSEPCGVFPSFDSTHVYSCKPNDANTVILGAACLTANRNDCATVAAQDFTVRFSKP